jgi:TonB-linked SusC/RagA family outer membrane protein
LAFGNIGAIYNGDRSLSGVPGHLNLSKSVSSINAKNCVMKHSAFQIGKIPVLISGIIVFLLVANAASGQIGGVVRSTADNQPIPGVTVSVKGTTRGIVTDARGQYRLGEVHPGDTIVFSAIGYQTRQRQVTSSLVVDALLEPSTESLSQLVVIGYGTQKKRDLTGSVSSVNAEKLADEHPKGLQDILRGNAAGLNVGFSASAEGGGSLEVRGRKSLNAGGTPLLVVDGVIYYGNLSDINPYDIASVDILKDASAAAVYGAKAANGVIIITTKRGVEGKPRINFNATFGLATMEVNQPVYSAQGYIRWRGDVMKATHANAQPYEYSDPRKLPSNISTDQWLAYDNSSGDPVTVWLQRLNFQPIEITNYKAGKSIDWYDKVFQTGLQQDYNVSISDKKKDLSYYWSLGYEDNDGIIVGDGFKTVRSRLNLQSKITKFLEVGLNTQFSIRDESQIPVSWSQMLNDSPWGSMYEDDGVTLRLSPQDQSAISSNPFLIDYEYRLQKYYNLTSSLFAKVTLPFGISYQLNFSPDIYWHNYYNHESTQNATWALKGGIATRTQDQQYRWQLDNLITWNRTFNKIHQITLTLLANAEKYQTWANTMTNNGFSPSDALGYHNMGIGDNPVISSNDTYSTGDALMARLFYSLKDKYMVTASVRRDGYSAFGQRHPRATFPSLALGWVFTDEKFLNAPWLSYGKLRLSYGINGNRDVGQYTALSQVSSGTYEHVNSSGTVIPVTTLRVSTMSNPDLKWEKTAAYNLGLDFTIKGNVLNGSIDAYRMSTTDLLVKRSLSSVVGFSYVMANLGEVQNKGVELTLNSTNMTRKNFSWHSTFTFSLNRNKIVHLYGDMEDVVDANGKVVGHREMDDVTNKWFIGHAIDAIWDLNEVGVYQTGEKAEAERYGVEPGDFKLQDVNNDGQLTDADRQFLGFTTPRYRWSLRNEFSIFKSFELSFLIYSYWGQKGVFDEAKNSGVTRYLDRQSAYDLPYWTPENPINDFAKLSSSNGSTTYDVYRSKSFIRLSTVALSYSLPESVIKRIKVQDMKVFFNVKDVYFYSPGEFLWDPENAGPTPRTFSMGVNLTL